MSKHTKKNRSKRSALKLEALEQRQLLATIVAGSGTEVDSNIKLSNGNTYDQILLTGSTVTVTADTVEGVNQVTRVDFLDANGDIVRAEFSGAGTLKVDLADFKDAAAPTEYNTTTKYVQGTATFTIVGSNETTNFSVFSLGSVNVHGGANSALFTGGKDGGDNWADVAALVIQDNGSVLGSAFGRIGAGNAHFSAESGAVGIIAPNIQFQGDIIIGDIDAKGSATGQLRIGAFGNNTVTVTGGDLDQTNGNLDGNNIANVDAVISSSGQTSFGTITNTSIIHASVAVNADKITYKSAAEKITINGATATQADLDVYKDKFLNEVEITGGLKEGLTLAARMIGNIKIGGDLAGLITTDVDNQNDSDTNELSIGNVEITGNIVKGGAIEASTTIGNVTVGGGIDFEDVDGAGNSGAAAIISTIGRASFSNKIGDITFGKSVLLDNEAKALVMTSAAGATSGGVGKISVTGDLKGDVATIISTAKGGIGDITVSGDIDVGAITGADGLGAIKGKSVDVGALSGGTEGVGAITSTDGSIVLSTITATKAIGAITSDGDIDFNGAVTGKSIGNISAADGYIDTDMAIKATDGSIGTLTAQTITIDALVNAKGGNIGAIAVTDGDLVLNGTLGTTGGDVTNNIGNITVSKGDLTVNQTISAKAIGDISVAAGTTTGGTLALAAGKTISATDGSIGKITVTGATGTSNANRAGVISFADATAQINATKAIGDITVTRGYITGAADSVEFAANTIGNVNVTARADAVNMQEYLLSNVAFVASGNSEETVGSAKIGHITLDASANLDGSIATGEAADDTNDGTGFSSSGNIGNITLKTAEAGQLVSAATVGLVFRAGSAGLGGNDAADNYATGVDENGGVSIGNVTITTDLSAALSNQSAGTGLVIASGVNVAAGGIFTSGTTAGIQNTVGKTGSGNTVGAVVLEDLSGTATHNGFVSAALTETGDDTTMTAGSVIIADQVTSVSLKTGAGTVLDLTGLNGLPLKGVIGVGVGAQDSYDAAEDTNLFVVVL